MTTPAATGDPTGELPLSGVRVGRVLGVPVLVSPSWLLFAAFVVISYGPALRDDFGTTRAYVGAGAFALLLLPQRAAARDRPLRGRAGLRPAGAQHHVTFLAGLTEITEPAADARPRVRRGRGRARRLTAAGRAGPGQRPAVSKPGSLPFLLALVVAVSNGLVAVFNLLPGLPWTAAGCSGLRCGTSP
jgi:Zn-dependent protease